MNFRPAFLALALAALAGSAQAGQLHTGGLPVANNTLIGTNLAAGIGNQAQQQLMASQSPGLQAPGLTGPGGNPLVVNNTQVATNVAAGIGNQARQNVVGLQGGAPLVGLDARLQLGPPRGGGAHQRRRG